MHLHKILLLIIALQFLIFATILYVLLDEINRLTNVQDDASENGNCSVNKKSRPITLSHNQTNISERNWTLKQLSKGSSVYCHGKTKTDRICKFQNLCYHSIWKKYIFFHGPWSFLVGVPNNRFDPALLDLSSVDDHNTQYFNFVDFPAKAVFDFNEVKIIKESSIIFNRFNPENLMHVFHDDLIPLFTTILRLTPAQDLETINSNTKLVMMDGREASIYNKLYTKLTKWPIIFEKNLTNELTCFKEAIVGLSKETTWYQYGFKFPQGPIENKNIDRIMLRYFSKHIKQAFDCAESAAKYVVLISRKQTRLILNQIEVSVALANMFKREIYLLDLEDIDISSAICLVNKAVAIVGMHGAELVLSLFLNHGSTVVELFPYGINPENYTPYKTLANLLELRYISWKNEDLQNSKGHPDRPPLRGGIRHLKEEDQIDIINSKVIPKHLCCDNPYWLYKIYQDTVIDILSLENQILEKLNSSDFKTSSKPTPYQAIPIFPDSARNITCAVEKTPSSRILKIHWNEPVNSKFFNEDLIYQVLVQHGSDDEEVNAYELKDTSLSLSSMNSTLPCRVWLRTKFKDKLGPYSSTIYCQ